MELESVSLFEDFNAGNGDDDVGSDYEDYANSGGDVGSDYEDVGNDVGIAWNDGVDVGNDRGDFGNDVGNGWNDDSDADSDYEDVEINGGRAGNADDVIVNRERSTSSPLLDAVAVDASSTDDVVPELNSASSRGQQRRSMRPRKVPRKLLTKACVADSMADPAVTSSSSSSNDSTLLIPLLEPQFAHLPDNNRSTPFPCLQCDQAFRKLSQLKAHLKAHKREEKLRGYKCETCGETFKQKHMLRKHALKHSQLRPFQCPQCVQAYKREMNLRLHLELHTLEGGFRCDSCDCGFKTQKAYAHHARVLHQLPVDYEEEQLEPVEGMDITIVPIDESKLVVPCPRCEKRFTTTDHLSLHESTVHDVCVEYNCEECDVSFITEDALLNHVAMDHNQDNASFVSPKLELPPEEETAVNNTPEQEDDPDYFEMEEEKVRKHACGVCGKRFVKSQHLKEHLDSHTDSSYECEHCNKVFKSKRGMERHKRTECEAELYRFKCPYPRCDRGFPSQEEMEAHHKIHNKTCEVCGKTFELRRRYVEHIASHSDVRPFECQQCGMTFKTKAALTTHAERHSDKPRFQCSLCDKIFRLKCHLKEHSRVHTAERPFSCPQCPKKFKSAKCVKAHTDKYHRPDQMECQVCHVQVSRKDIDAHMISHRKFKCEYCQKTLKTASSFTYHEKVSCPVLHGYRCLHCQGTFSTEMDLAQHKSTTIQLGSQCVPKGKDDKKFACHLCESSFERKSHLEDHIIVVHKKIKRFHCENCGQSFLHRASHERHVLDCGVAVPQ